jgi:hypothetical protein
VSGDDVQRPWWYSGEPEGSDPGGEDVNGPGIDASAGAGSGADDESADTGSAPGVDWTLLVAGAQRMVDWATERVMAPHAEHGDPAEHPQCVVCRTLVMVGDAEGMRPPAPAESADAAVDEPGAIVWIPIREDDDPSGTAH